MNERLNRLQEQMKDQMDINEQLIKDIIQQKEAILKGENILGFTLNALVVHFITTNCLKSS